MDLKSNKKIDKIFETNQILEFDRTLILVDLNNYTFHNSEYWKAVYNWRSNQKKQMVETPSDTDLIKIWSKEKGKFIKITDSGLIGAAIGGIKSHRVKLDEDPIPFLDDIQEFKTKQSIETHYKQKLIKDLIKVLRKYTDNDQNTIQLVYELTKAANLKFN